MKHFPHRRRLQIKGDASIRQYLYQQTRQETIFDRNAEQLMQICEKLLCERDAFHIKIHWSSNQLTVWNYTTPYEYQVFVGEEVFEPAFLENSPPSRHWCESKLSREEINYVLQTFPRLRFGDDHVYMRSGGINVINGMISMTFSCDGSHYVPFDEFDETVKSVIDFE